MKKVLLLPWFNLLGCVLITISTLTSSTFLMAQNISTGLGTTGDVQADPNWTITPTGGAAITVASYTPYWQPTPVPGTGARWINRTGYRDGQTVGEPVYDRLIRVPSGSNALTLSFSIAYDDDIVSVDIIDPTGMTVENLVSSVIRPTTPTPYYLSNVINRTYTCPKQGDWILRVKVKFLDEVGAFMLSGSANTTQGVCQPNCKAGFNFASTGNNCGAFQFTNTSTGVAPITYSWNFGDPTSGSNTSTLANPTHTFACGTYNVCLKITGADGCKDSICKPITIDIAPPTLTCPPNLTLACDGNTTPSVTGTATATDNCSTPVVGYTDNVFTSVNFCKRIQRTWTATDACGNITLCVQTISIVDNTPPVVSCPPNITVNCLPDTAVSVTGRPTVTDCPGGSLLMTYADVVSGVLPCDGSIQRRWRITDACGNVAFCTQTITVADKISPKITCPPNITILCSRDTTPSVSGRPTVSDNCLTPIFTYSDVISGSLPCDGSIRRTWTAVDACDNRTTCVQTILVRDTVRPVIICPSPSTVTCVSNGTPSVTGTATATDNCGNTPVLTYSDVLLGVGLPCFGTIRRTWTARDACGNTASCVQDITVNDNIAPTLVCPPNISITCTRDTSPTVTGTATATDNCQSFIQISYGDVVTGILPCGGTISRTWTAVDRCGNRATCVQTITVRDSIKPTIVCPQNLTVNTLAGQCYYQGQLPSPTASDNCAPNPSIVCTLGGVTITPSTQFPKGVNTISCFARDACGNISLTCTYTVTVVDNEKPTITCPLSITVTGTITPPSTQCKAVVNGLAPTVTDNCPMTTVTYGLSGATVGSGVNDVSGTMFMSGVTTVTYSVTDMAGNKDSCKFTVKVTCDTTQQSDFKGFNCGQAIISCFSGFIGSPAIADPNGPVLAMVDMRQHALAPLGINWAAASSSKIYHKADWVGSKMGQIFGVTIDGNNNVYASATTMYGYYMPSPLTNADYGNVYKIDAITGNVTVFATLPQAATPAGLGDVWYDAANNQLFVSNFSDGKIYRITGLSSPTGTVMPFPYDYSGTAIGVPSPGFIARGERVWAVATYANYLYFSVWNEDRLRKSAAIKNQIRRIPLGAGGVPPTTGAGTLVHDMSDLITIDAAGGPNTEIYSSPVSDIQFSQSGNMLVAERSMNNDFGDALNGLSGDQAHVSRVIEISPASVEKLYHVGNLYSTGTVSRHHANSAGGIDYGYESFNPSASPKPSLCDSMIWTTGDALRYLGYNTLPDASSLPCGGGTADYVYGLAGIRSRGNSNILGSSDFVKNNSIYIDVDNDICRRTKIQIGDIDIFKCGCPSPTAGNVCDSISVTSTPSTTTNDSCCFVIKINNQVPNFFTGITLCTQAGVSISSVSALSGWSLSSYTASAVSVVPTGGPGAPIPVVNQDFIKFCLSNYATVPNQTVIVKYYGLNYEVVCTDTLVFNCTQKPKCIKVLNDTITCGENGKYKMTFCVMSDAMIPWSASSFQLNAPAGVTFTPSVFTLSPALLPGQTRCTFTTEISGPNATDGKTVCFSITAHKQNIPPILDCCTDTVMQACVKLPTCICSKLSAVAVPATATNGACCWKINLTNGYSNTYFTGVHLDILTPGVVFGAINNPFGSGWYSSSTATSVDFTKIPVGTFIGATAMLPEFCLSGISTAAQVPQIIVLKWLGPDSKTVCTDTLIFRCPPPVNTPCAALIDPIVKCDSLTGAYTLQFQVFNNSGSTINEVALNLVTPPSSMAPNVFTLATPLLNGQTSPILTTNIFGVPAGNQVCFKLTLHQKDANGNDLNCCTDSTKYCLTMPQCPSSCDCGTFNISYVNGVNPPVTKRCGDTIILNNPTIAILNFNNSFSCVGNSNTCPDSVRINYTLTGPTGFSPLSGATLARPTFNISYITSSFSMVGLYTLTMSGTCGTKQCTCKLYFRVDSVCCINRDQFVRNINSAVNVTVNNALCKATVNIGTLPNCDEVSNIQWGDGTTATGPFTAGSMPMHTYTGSGTYIITTLALEKNPATGLICFEYQRRDTIKLVCDTCRCGTFTEMTFRPTQGAQTSIVKCGDTLTLSCNSTFNPIFGGNFQCVGNCTATIKWELRKLPTGGAVIASGSVASPNFTLTLLGSYFATAGQYELTFTGQCGTTVCPPCKFIIKVLPSVNLGTGLTGYFPFNGNANDVSPTLINGTGTNLIPASALNGGLSAYTFNGSSSMIDATNNNRGVTDKVSVCAWVRTTETAKGMWVAGQYNGSQAKGYLLSIGDVTNSSGSIGLASFSGRVDNSTYNAAISPATKKVNDGTWHCLVGTAGIGTSGNSEWKIYVDGTLQNMVLGATSTINPSNTPFTIGRHSDLSIGTMWYNGNMDDVRVYNKVLTQCEIDSLCSTRLVSGVGDVNDRMHVSIFPNPTPGIFTVELSMPAKSNMSFRITDLMGRAVLEKQIEVGNTQQTVTASELTEGLYFLQVVSDGKVIGVEKFVKQ